MKSTEDIIVNIAMSYHRGKHCWSNGKHTPRVNNMSNCLENFHQCKPCSVYSEPWQFQGSIFQEHFHALISDTQNQWSCRGSLISLKHNFARFWSIKSYRQTKLSYNIKHVCLFIYNSNAFSVLHFLSN